MKYIIVLKFTKQTTWTIAAQSFKYNEIFDFVAS